MTLARTKKPATYQDVLDAPEHVVAEIVNGELHTSPRPRNRHARASFRIGSELGPFDRPRGDDPGGWLILVEPELHLGPQVLVPDLAGWRHARMPEMPDAPFFTLVPDWVCEVASPSTQRLDRELKMPLYRDHGVEWLWLVDPATPVVQVFRGEGRGWMLVTQSTGDGPVRLPPFDAIEVDPADWFSREVSPGSR